jgi:RimJ/RimL family protein N-acetyltransferase
VQEPDAVITSERLRMPILSRDQLERLAGGDGVSVARELGASLSDEWVDDVRGLARRRAAQLGQRPLDGPWLLRPIVLAAGDEAIGYLNFHGAPDARGMVEIGYTLLPAARGRGYAIEAVRAMLDWALRVHGVRILRASVAPDNERSRNLVTKLGLVQVGEQWDSTDGLELVYEREFSTDER